VLPVLLVSAIMIAAMHGPKSYASVGDIQTSGQSPDPEVTLQYDRNPSALLVAYRKPAEVFGSLFWSRD